MQITFAAIVQATADVSERHQAVHAANLVVEKLLR